MNKRIYFLVLLPLLLNSALASGTKREVIVARIVRIISADTLTVLYKERIYEVRLLGINAPEIFYNDELYQEALKYNLSPESVIEAGRRALAFVQNFLQYGSQVKLEFDRQKQDRYGRWLCYVYLKDGRMLNLLLLNEKLVTLELVAPNLRYKSLFLEAARSVE